MEFETPCACATLRRAARAVTAAYDAALAPSGLRITQFSILRKLARLGPLPVTRLAAEAALDRSTMGRNLNPLERRGLVRIEVGNVDQREHVVYLTAAGEAAIEAALPYWRKTQKRIAALVEFSAIGELADQLDAGGRVEQNSRVRKKYDDQKMPIAIPDIQKDPSAFLLELKGPVGARIATIAAWPSHQ